ncbi:DUF881 domain-containing protein [Kitasatospora purpeofusca]|uniref:DUF881 domain-containing protein n=1 Tax=Kitasatospora purpeofusca TaxID=67352 RepID=UPI002E2D9579|nr:DUF881 domain-containing protein [Kitasatospora purpeofusca]
MSATPGQGASSGRYNRPDASMSLLTNVMDHSLDEGYAEAAAARGGDGPYRIPGTVRGLITLGAGLALVGAVITVGAVNAHKAEPTLAKERDALIHRINDANGSADHLQQQVQDLRRKVDSTQRQALAPGEGDPAALAGAVGLAEVAGPGVKLVLEDAAGTGAGGNVDPRAGQGFSNSGRLRDRDLQLVVNGLWASGAEAVSINGQRLTALSAIRAAGEAVLVDNRPLVPPYTVQALGDGPRLLGAFESAMAGQYLRLLQEKYGIKSTLSTQKSLTLPAAVGVSLRTAQPAVPEASPTGAPTGGASGSPSGSPSPSPSAPASSGPSAGASPSAKPSGSTPAKRSPSTPARTTTSPPPASSPPAKGSRPSTTTTGSSSAATGAATP